MFAAAEEPHPSLVFRQGQDLRDVRLAVGRTGPGKRADHGWGRGEIEALGQGALDRAPRQPDLLGCPDHRRELGVPFVPVPRGAPISSARASTSRNSSSVSLTKGSAVPLAVPKP